MCVVYAHVCVRACADISHSRASLTLVQVLKGMDWPPPDGGALSPAGEYNLYLGITKEFTPDMIATASEPASAFEGHAFIIEAAV